MDEYQNDITWDSTPATATGVTFLSTTTVRSTAFSEDLRWGAIVLSIIMGAISIVTVVGNLAVLLSYYIDKNIRQPSNYFIFSLAVSDLVSLKSHHTILTVTDMLESTTSEKSSIGGQSTCLS